MPFWLAPLLGGIGYVMGSLVGRVLMALGMTYVTYTGMSAGVEWILQNIQSTYNSLPVDVANFLSFMWVDKAITMVFSAFTTAIAFKTMGTGVVKKLVLQ